MKQFFKNHWKVMLLILIIILGFILYYELLPKYNQLVINIGYNQALTDLANKKTVPLSIMDGNESRIIPVEVCSEIFVQQYKNICGG